MPAYVEESHAGICNCLAADLPQKQVKPFGGVAQCAIKFLSMRKISAICNLMLFIRGALSYHLEI